MKKTMKQPSSARRSAMFNIALAGTLGAGGMIGLLREALASGARQGITHMKGLVLLDGKPAQLGQRVALGQRIVTGPDSEVVFVIGTDAFMQRDNSELALESNLGVSVLRFISGKVLSVFGKGKKQLRTPTATIGIRGTACYIEAEAARTYFCLCYGEAEVIPQADPAAKEIFRTRHHERPVYIGNQSGVPMMAKGPMINHTDAELIMLESLVGRQPPFMGQSYPSTY